MKPFIFERRRFRRANSDLDETYIPIPNVVEETKVGKVFSTYMTWYILGYILLLSVKILKIDI